MKNTMSTERKFRNTASFGKRQEYIAIAELLKLGHDVYMTLVDDQQIDCIIRHGDHDYIDLQIKARSNGGNFAAMKIPNPREKYFFIFYCQQINTYWVFPSIDLVSKASRNKKGDNKGKYSINLTGVRKRKECSGYENNFELLMANP